MKLSDLFSDHMVFQRNKPINLWGEGEGKVCVQLGGNRYYTACDCGRWSAVIPPMPAGGPYELIISDRVSSVVLNDVMIGEVWLAAGQSNMEHSLFSAAGGLEAAKKMNNPNIRLFTVPRRTEPGYKGHRWHFESVKAEDEPWQLCSEQAALHFSAVGGLFGELLQKSENVAVGIISCNFGGTRIEAFIDQRRIFSNPKLKRLSDFCSDTLERLDMEEYDRQCETFYKKMSDECIACDALELFKKLGLHDFARCSPIKWPELPQPGPRWENWPGVLYKNMVKRIIPFSLGGVLWYQGESNTYAYWEYFELFREMVKNWREDWNDELPFFTVQIAPFRYPVPQAAPLLVEQQVKAARSIKGVYLVSSTDIGEADNIHPSNKQVIAVRLFNAVQSVMFGKKKEYSGPVAQEAYRLGNKITVKFSHAGGGLFSDGKIEELYVLDRDGGTVPADYEICGDTLTVWADGVQSPAGVQMGFSNFCKIALKNGAGYAAVPFRIGGL